jgi:outer membrane protein assembly factor BamE
MRMLLSHSTRAPALGACCLVLAACLPGCASKNPLIDEPVASTATQPAAAPTKTAAGAPVAAPVAANSGAQTTAPTGLRRFLGMFAPYRIDVQQGNFVSQEMVAQLKEGMTQEQVRFVLGTPLLTDMFHAERWDYPFSLQKGNGEVISSRVTVFFKDNKLARFEGGNLPTEKEYLARITGPATEAKADSPSSETK